MAEHGALGVETAAGTGYADHRRTYDGFLRLLRFSMAAAFGVLALMAFFLT